MSATRARLCLTGDVMCGRGIDQILRHPGDPAIHEPHVQSARRYVELAEKRSGPIPRMVEPAYVWGEALDVLDAASPDAVIVNLETAVTDRGRPWPGKGIQYRMNPANVDCLTVAGIDVAVLANNHVMDWSVEGLEQTLDVLHGAAIGTAGAGRDAAEAWAPATVELPGGSRVLVSGLGSTSSGIPPGWEANERGPGVAMLADPSDRTVERIADVVQTWVRPGDVVVASVHWGGNWGYEIGPDRRRLAHRLIDEAGVDVVHGHSSHHPLGIEVHRGRLILYGCGDLLNDYEGIGGHERFRGGLGGLYLVSIETGSGELRELTIVPTEIERFRLVRPDAEKVGWLADVLDREGRDLGTSVGVDADATLTLRW